MSGKGAKIKNFENHEDILNKVDSVLEEAKIRLSLITHHLQALHPALHKLREEVTKPMLVPQLRNKLLLSDHRKGLEEAKEKLGRKRKEVKAKKEEIQQKMREFRERRPLSMKPLELPQM